MMNYAKSTLLLVAALCGVMRAEGAERQGGKGKGIDDATVVAYEKVGGKYGGWKADDSGEMTFTYGKENVGPGVLPGFVFEKMPTAPLPPVAVPFGLVMSACKATDADIKVITGLKNLIRLDLSYNYKLTEAGFKELGVLKSIVSLKLGANSVSEGSLKELKKLENLTDLDIDSLGRLTADGIKEVSGYQKLTALRIGHNDLKDEGLKGLTTIKGLTHLDLSFDLLTDACMGELKKFQSLTKLSLPKNAISDAGLKDVLELKNLTWLDLSDTKVSDEGLTRLSGLKSLKWLDLRDSKATAAGVKKLRMELPKCDIRQ